MPITKEQVMNILATWGSESNMSDVADKIMEFCLVEADAATQIAEHAFKSGVLAAIDRFTVPFEDNSAEVLEEQERLWDEYEPSESIKELTK